MHEQELSKLNRIAGQVDGIRKMIADHRDCPEILTQLRAIRAAIRTVEANILEAHLKSCVVESMTHGDRDAAMEKIDELKNLFKRFDTE